MDKEEETYRKNRLGGEREMNKKLRNDAIVLTIKLYPHKHGQELASEIIEYLDVVEERIADKTGVKDGN